MEIYIKKDVHPSHSYEKTSVAKYELTTSHYLSPERGIRIIEYLVLEGTRSNPTAGSTQNHSKLKSYI